MKTAQKGFMAILTVIALLAFSLSLSVAVTYLSINESQAGLAVSRGAGALAHAEGCAEDALLRSTRDENYSGGTYDYFEGTCVIDVARDGTVWTVDVAGTKDGFTRTVRLIFEYVPGPPGSVTLVSWLER